MKNKKGKLMRFEHNSSNKTEVQAQPVEQKEKEEQKGEVTLSLLNEKLNYLISILEKELK